MSVNSEKNLHGQVDLDIFPLVKNDLLVERPLYNISKSLGVALLVILIIWRVGDVWWGGGSVGGKKLTIQGAELMSGKTTVKFNKMGISPAYIWNHDVNVTYGASTCRRDIEYIVEEYINGKWVETGRTSSCRFAGKWKNYFRFRVDPSLRKTAKIIIKEEGSTCFLGAVLWEVQGVGSIY